MTTAWTLAIIGIFIVFCITCWAMDRSHRKRLEEHAKRMDEIYKKYR